MEHLGDNPAMCHTIGTGELSWSILTAEKPNLWWTWVDVTMCRLLGLSNRQIERVANGLDGIMVINGSGYVTLQTFIVCAQNASMENKGIAERVLHIVDDVLRNVCKCEGNDAISPAIYDSIYEDPCFRRV